MRGGVGPQQHRVAVHRPAAGQIERGFDGVRRAGPTLAGLFGRRAGSVPGYVYSDTVANADIVWTEDTIDALFDLGPEHYIPGTKMPMQRIANPQDRADLIAFLKHNTEG